MLSKLTAFGCLASLFGATCAISAPAFASDPQFHVSAQAGVQSAIDIGPRMVVAVSGSVQDGKMSYFLARLQANVGKVEGETSQTAAWLSGYHLSLTPVSMVVAGRAATVEGAGIVGALSISFLPSELQRELLIGVDTKTQVRVMGIEGETLLVGNTDAGLFGVAADLSLQLLGYQYLNMQNRLISGDNPFHGIEVGSAQASVKALWGFMHSGDTYVKQLSIGVRVNTDVAIGMGDSAGTTTQLFKLAGRIALQLRVFGLDHSLYFDAGTQRQYTYGTDLTEMSRMPLILESGLITRFN